MIVTETFYVDGHEFVRTHSDRGVLVHGGFPEGDYSEACDPAELNRTYVETEIPIEQDENEEIDA